MTSLGSAASIGCKHGTAPRTRLLLSAVPVNTATSDRRQYDVRHVSRHGRGDCVTKGRLRGGREEWAWRNAALAVFRCYVLTNQSGLSRQICLTFSNAKVQSIMLFRVVQVTKSLQDPLSVNLTIIHPLI